MKKGFTLVELAIVLVIVGLIMGMAIKGKEIINVAKLTADVARIKKIQTSIYEYNAKHDTSMPPITLQVYVDKKVLGLTEADVKLASANKLYFSIFVGTFGSDGLFNRYYSPFSYNTEVATTVQNSPANNSSNATSFPRRLACQIEVTLDDRSLLSGDGRTYPLTDNMSYDDCYSENGGGYYVFRILNFK